MVHYKWTVHGTYHAPADGAQRLLQQLLGAFFYETVGVIEDCPSMLI